MTQRQTRTAIVTGASKGIGAAIAVALAREGHEICANYRVDEIGANETVESCQAAGVRAIAVSADVGDPEAVCRMFDTCDESLNPVTCLVNNAGIIGGSTTLANLEKSKLYETFETNVFGAIYCIQEAVKRMRTDKGGFGGSIVNISSIAATLGSPGEYVHYAASKGAIETLTIGAGKELGSMGIRVNAIRVGTTDTDLHEREGNPDRPAMVAAATPLGRIAHPGDIANAVVWITSSRAEFVSGTVLTVAGGLAP